MARESDEALVVALRLKTPAIDLVRDAVTMFKPAPSSINQVENEEVVAIRE